MLELADAVVVGGGILGLALTEALSRRFSRVLLVEAERCGAKATGSGFAWVNASSKWQNAEYHRLNAEACRVHLALATVFDAARTGWNGGGSLPWASQSDRAAALALEDRIALLQSWEYPVARLNGGEMQALEPHVRFGSDAVGLFAPSEGWVSTQRLTRFYIEQARERHASLAEFTHATGFSFDHRGAIASVETTAGRVSTRIVVLCAGTATGDLARNLFGQPIPFPDRILTASPGVLVETAPLPANARVHRVCYPEPATGLHMRPTPEGGLLIGADDVDTRAADQLGGVGPSTQRDDFVDRDAAMLLECTAAVLPDFDRATPATPRTCYRPLPTDGLPVVGEVPGVQGAYLLVSHSGVTLGPLLGQLLAEEIVTGRNSPWLAPYRPARFLS